MSSVVNTIMRVAIIILVVGISVLLSKYFMAISTTTTTKKNRIYNLNDCRICLHKITTINHEIIGHMDKVLKALLVDGILRKNIYEHKEGP
jgi:protein subunit release factor A